MKNLLRLLAVSTALLLIVVSCEPDIPQDDIIRDELLGTWQVNETAGWNAPQFYEVEIRAGSGPLDLEIRGLYNLPDTRVRARVEGFSLNIPNHSTAGVNFSGTGSVNADLDQVNLNFMANDGTGQDEVGAVMTR